MCLLTRGTVSPLLLCGECRAQQAKKRAPQFSMNSQVTALEKAVSASIILIRPR